MRFTLTYRGPLATRGNARQKHTLRRALHPQIKELWTHRPLEHFAPRWLDRNSASDEAGRALRQTAGYDFAVVVATDQLLLAELDVLLLRPESPGSILQNADIDNRLKTLFDAPAPGEGAGASGRLGAVGRRAAAALLARRRPTD